MIARTMKGPEKEGNCYTQACFSVNDKENETVQVERPFI